MNKVTPIIGFVLLSIMVLLLFGFASYKAWTLQPAVGVVMTFILLGLLFEIMSESKEVRKVKSDLRSGATKRYISYLRESKELRKVKLDVLTRKNLFLFISVFVGTFANYALRVNTGLDTVVATGLVMIIAAIILPDYGVPISCGAFVGMASPALLNHGQMAIAVAVAGVVYVLTVGVFDGFGGKLGTIAFTGCVITGLCLGSEFAHLPVPGWDVGWLIVVYSIIAAVVSFWINIYLKRGAVMAPGIVGLAGGLILPAIHPDIGGMLASMVICAALSGMSSAKRFPHIMPLAIVGLVAGLVFVYSMPLLGGAGGKFGTIAFGSVTAVRGYLDLVEKLRATKRDSSPEICSGSE